ncbi:zinc finger MYM-type protein 1-like protein [Tanacetum coccineum]|uniref:Zinc finger MYM-type protein 1-like protein n=1 Tax=Tanacetum coccineum TaxID=301880 RepID=A0ABQ5IUR2_9ASTR
MPPIRKQKFGYAKRLEKKKAEQLTQSQSGTMDNYVIKTPHVSSSNNEDVGNVGGGDNNDEYVDMNVDEDGVNNTDVNHEDVDDVNNEDVDDVKLDNDDDDDGVHDEETNIDYDHVEDVDVDINVDIFDPRNWDSLSSDMIKHLVAGGPKRDKSMEKGPKDKSSRRFTAYYTRVLPNNDKCDREWLVYSKELDKLFVFVVNYLEKALRKNHIMKFLAKHNLAFRGTNEKLYKKSNENFLGLIEMLQEFDPVIKEHVRRITRDDMHVHYLGHTIQNEFILLLAHEIKSKIINKVKQAKYFSVILDCTPDTSHQEQMSLILRYVNVSSTCVTIEESFLGFLNVDETTGKRLFDVTLDELKSLDLDIDDVRSQGYDNGSNMKGKHQGVQKRFLDINPRAFYTACGCHSLNLALCDMANTCAKGRDFFGIIQRIYTIFANSSKRWQILKDNVKGLTLKSLSITRWESRVESVKAIRFQISDIREALLQVAETDNDSLIQSQAKSLATNELGDFEFLVAIVIWFEILYVVNLVSKKLQSSDMLIDIAIKEVKGLISFFEEFRETGLSKAINDAKEIAVEMDIDPVFVQKRVIRRKRQFDENTIDDDASFSAEESFKINYFLYIVDQAIGSLRTRFEQYTEYANIFGFLFSCDKLKSYDDKSLKLSCTQLEAALKNGERSDIDANELFMELRLLDNFLPSENMAPVDVLTFLKQRDCFPNALIAYRVLLTIPVTVASAERSFSKLKLLKSYLRSSMSQERLNGLAMIAIENDLLSNVDYKEMVKNFALRNAERIARFTD